MGRITNILWAVAILAACSNALPTSVSLSTKSTSETESSAKAAAKSEASQSYAASSKGTDGLSTQVDITAQAQAQAEAESSAKTKSETSKTVSASNLGPDGLPTQAYINSRETSQAESENSAKSSSNSAISLSASNVGNIGIPIIEKSLANGQSLTQTGTNAQATAEANANTLLIHVPQVVPASAVSGGTDEGYKSITKESSKSKKENEIQGAQISGFKHCVTPIPVPSQIPPPKLEQIITPEPQPKLTIQPYSEPNHQPTHPKDQFPTSNPQPISPCQPKTPQTTQPHPQSKGPCQPQPKIQPCLKPQPSQAQKPIALHTQSLKSQIPLKPKQKAGSCPPSYKGQISPLSKKSDTFPKHPSFRKGNPYAVPKTVIMNKKCPSPVPRQSQVPGTFPESLAKSRPCVGAKSGPCLVQQTFPMQQPKSNPCTGAKSGPCEVPRSFPKPCRPPNYNPTAIAKSVSSQKAKASRCKRQATEDLTPPTVEGDNGANTGAEKDDGTKARCGGRGGYGGYGNRPVIIVPVPATTGVENVEVRRGLGYGRPVRRPSLLQLAALLAG